MTTTHKTIKRLEYLAGMLAKYRHCISDNGTSNRIGNWISDYNDVKWDNEAAWNKYCDKHGLVHDHNAADAAA